MDAEIWGPLRFFGCEVVTTAKISTLGESFASKSRSGNAGGRVVALAVGVAWTFEIRDLLILGYVSFRRVPARPGPLAFAAARP